MGQPRPDEQISHPSNQIPVYLHVRYTFVYSLLVKHFPPLNHVLTQNSLIISLPGCMHSHESQMAK